MEVENGAFVFHLEGGHEIRQTPYAYMSQMSFLYTCIHYAQYYYRERIFKSWRHWWQQNSV